MSACFLLELTSMSPATRFKVFRTQLTKVFMTLVVFYLASFLFTALLDSVSFQITELVVIREKRYQRMKQHYYKQAKKSI